LPANGVHGLINQSINRGRGLLFIRAVIRRMMIGASFLFLHKPKIKLLPGDYRTSKRLKVLEAAASVVRLARSSAESEQHQQVEAISPCHILGTLGLINGNKSNYLVTPSK
jgi:hypothetical protein